MAPKKNRKDYCRIANQYLKDVLSGKIPACKWIKAACQRQIDDLARAKKKDPKFPFYFDADAGNRICRFLELMPHIKGNWGSPLIVLAPWQCFFLSTVFGWKNRKNGFRRFRFVYVEVPRKNAKSTISSGVGLYMLAVDNEGGAECYSAATTKEQARIVFSVAQGMARHKLTKDFRKKFGVDVGAHTINVLETASSFTALSSDSKTLDGLNVHFGCIDELHAHKTREVFDVIETGTGSRTQSLLWAITTAGSDRGGVCYEQRIYLTKVLNSVFKRHPGLCDHDLRGDSVNDESFFGLIYTIDDTDDWTSPAVWQKANPNWDVSVLPFDMERLAKKAMKVTASQNAFKTKRLNVWVNADTSWMNMLEWDACARPGLKLADFRGVPCYLGLDLASRIDIAALVLLFIKGGQYYQFGRYYLPREGVQDRAAVTCDRYEPWAEDGLMVLTEGNVIDFGQIKQDIMDLCGEFKVEQIAYDPWQATQLSQELEANGLQLVEIRPTVQNFSEPMKELEALVKARRFFHAGNPVFDWMLSNVVCHSDHKDNIYPNKERDENKIDGVVALLMALGRALYGETGRSAYDEGELLVL